MWKIQTAALQRTRGRTITGLVQRALLPASSTTTTAASATSAAATDNSGRGSSSLAGSRRRCYSQTVGAATPSASASTDAATTATPMTLPPNLRFDFKSTFAPERNLAVLDELESESESKLELELDPAVDDDNKSSDGDDSETADEFPEEFYEDDEDSPLLFVPDPLRNHRSVRPLPERLQVPIRDGPSSEEVGSVWLDPSIFGVEEIRVDLIAQNVNYIRNKIRGVRTAKSKTVSEVSGSGRKVRAQKGGGIARAGHSRPAHWRGGAKAHGPKNTKDYGAIKFNKRARVLAIRSVLSQKLKEGNLILVNHLQLDSHKTGPWAKVLEKEYGVGKAIRKTTLRNQPDRSQTTSALILDHYLEPETSDGSDEKTSEDYHASYQGVPINLWVSSSNIPRVTVRNHRFLNVYDVLKNEKLIVTLSALEQIEERWSEK
mmetsp:Transcript_12341/g.28954  ORF Transcript_12341/g.28954 Transcript_12341/m.28954 type:complete len:433 (-) Transcript_12341:239-1537(-)